MDKQSATCHICGRQAFFYSSYLGKHLCGKHFEKMLVRRVRSVVTTEIGQRKAFRKVMDGSAAFRFIDFVFRSGESDTTLFNNVLEDFAIAVLGYFVFDEKPKIAVKSASGVSPLFTTSEKEIENFLKLKKLCGGSVKRRKRDAYVLNMLYELEGRRPGGMLSLVKIGRRLGII